MPESPHTKIRRAREIGGQAPQERTWWTSLWRPFWAVPLAIVLAAVAVGAFLPELDKVLALDMPYIFQGGPDGARSLLSTIATAMISVTGLVFSITMVVLQLAANQFTPRVLDAFLGSRITQVTLGLFAASFVYSLTVMRSVRGDFDDIEAFVPQTSVTLAFVIVLAAIGMFLAFINHITTSTQVGAIISRVGRETTSVIETMYPAAEEAGALPLSWSPEPGTPHAVVTVNKREGYVSQLRYAALTEKAAKADAVIDILVAVGTHVIAGQPVARIWGMAEIDDDLSAAVHEGISLDKDRWMHQDPAYGIRRLVDIGDRALSPGVNDPTTAVQVIHELHTVLRTLVQLEHPSPYVTRDGEVRILHRPQKTADMVRLAVEELQHYGADTLQIRPRLEEMLEDLLEAATPVHRVAVEECLERVRAS